MSVLIVSANYMRLGMPVRSSYIKVEDNILQETAMPIMPEGDAIRRAIKWISAELSENPDKPVMKLVNEAVTRFDLSPKDSEFLISFYKSAKDMSSPS